MQHINWPHWSDLSIHQDLASDGGGLPVHQRRSSIAEEYLTEEIHLNCTDEKSLVAGSSALNKLSRFFDKVIDKQFYKRDKSQDLQAPMQQQQQRRRAHYD